MAGTLYLCATPIGNLQDITQRVLDTLRSVDLIAAEDTRNSYYLLNHFGIETPMTSYHEHNKYEKAEVLIGKLLAGQDIALITDAGTPVISDPGEVLAIRCIEEGIPMTSLPGPCACITALTLSGLPGRRFVFEGFLPTDKKEHREVLESLAKENRTFILYEAPHRLVKTLKELLDAVGDRKIALCRELTKRFETVIHTTLAEAVELYESGEEEPRGEYVLVLAGRSQDDIARDLEEQFKDFDIREHVQMYEEKGMNHKDAMKAVAKERGISRRDVYQALLEEEG